MKNCGFFKVLTACILIFGLFCTVASAGVDIQESVYAGAVLDAAQEIQENIKLKAKPAESGIDALAQEYTLAKSGGNTYAYYSPVKSKNYKVEYPVVVFIHGLFNGVTDKSFRKNGLTLWASEEMQAKWSEGGAHLIMPRILDLNPPSTEELFSIVDGYIKENKANVNTGKVYLMGSSAGAAKAWKLLIAHPSYFKAGVFIGSTKTRSEDEARKVANVPVWEVSAKTDPFISILFQKKTWNNICKTTAVKSECRWSVFQNKVYHPDGSSPLLSHFLGKAVGYDFCFVDNNQPYGGMDNITADVKEAFYKSLEQEKNDEISQRMVEEISTQIQHTLVKMAEVVEIPLG